MSYEATALGMTEVRAASGVPAGVPGSWWSRKITPDGEIRNSEKSIGGNLSRQIGGSGNVHRFARYWTTPIGGGSGRDALNPLMGLGTAVSFQRVLGERVTEITGSEAAGDVMSCAAEYGVPGVARYVPWISLIPIGAAAAVYYWQTKKGTSRGKSAAYGLATWVGLPVAWCSLVRAVSPMITM